MSGTEPAYLLNALSFGILIFSGHLLLLNKRERPYQLPLVGCFFGMAILISKTLFTNIDIQVSLLILSLPVLLIIAPCFWLYIEGLTSTHNWQLTDINTSSFYPAGVAALIAIFAYLLPDPIKIGLFVEGEESVLADYSTLLRNIVYTMLIITFAMIMGWIGQSIYYLVKIFRRLAIYRQTLRGTFSNVDHIELRWINTLVIMLLVTWFAQALPLFIDNLITPFQLNNVVSAFMTLVLIWYLALWSLKQNKAFDSEEDITMTEGLANSDSEPTKYQRSPLSKQQLLDIKAKTINTMEENELYLDASLSLRKLATSIGVSPNYLSQTLNEEIGMTFFDYVNSHRIKASQKRLLETDSSIVDIAYDVGFNAKSSFYNAFKKHTQLTPSQFRAQGKSHEK